MFNYRTMTNVPTQRNPQQRDNGDADTGAGGAAEADGGGAGDNMEQAQSAQNHDARKARNAKIKCDLCPMSTSKVFNSMVALHIHQCGMHGPGWTSLCGKNYKWKSQYTRQNKTDCKICIKKKADLKLIRYQFLSNVDLTEWNVLQMDVTQGNVNTSSILRSPCVNCAF